MSVRDGSNNVVGSFLGHSFGDNVSQFEVIKNGYQFVIGIDGRFFRTQLSVYFTGAGCTGTPYASATSVGEKRYQKQLIFKTVTNTLYEMANAVNGMATSVATPVFASRADTTNPSACVTTNLTPAAVFQLQAIAPSAFGVVASGNPLAVATPVTVQ